MRSPDERTLRRIYRAAERHRCMSLHHFQEPWFPDGRVVRIMGHQKDLAALTKEMPEVAWEEWSAKPDEALFGVMWPAVRNLFEASSRIALDLVDDPEQRWMSRKLIHCILNSWGLSPEGEAAFAKSLRAERKRMIRHDRWWRIRQRIRPSTCKWGCHRPEWA